MKSALGLKPIYKRKMFIKPAPVNIPEVTISPTHRDERKISSQINNTCDQGHVKLLLSPPHVSGYCTCSKPEVNKFEDPVKKRLRSRSHSSAQASAAQTAHSSFDENIVFRTSSSGSYLSSTSSRRERMSTTVTESLLSRNRRRKVAIPILCARAAAMVGTFIYFKSYLHNCRILDQGEMKPESANTNYPTYFF
jgi:hypothetical protein